MNIQYEPVHGPYCMVQHKVDRHAALTYFLLQQNKKRFILVFFCRINDCEKKLMNVDQMILDLIKNMCFDLLFLTLFSLQNHFLNNKYKIIRVSPFVTFQKPQQKVWCIQKLSVVSCRIYKTWSYLLFCPKCISKIILYPAFYLRVSSQGSAKLDWTVLELLDRTGSYRFFRYDPIWLKFRGSRSNPI